MYCFKIFYTLKPFTHIKINFKITPTCFGPTGPTSGTTSFVIPKLTTDHLLVRYIVRVLPDDGPVWTETCWSNLRINFNMCKRF